MGIVLRYGYDLAEPYHNGTRMDCPTYALSFRSGRVPGQPAFANINGVGGGGMLKSVSWSDKGRHPTPHPSIRKREDAKARFSEVVRRALAEGSQRVTVRGKDAVVVISAEALDKLLPPEKPRQDLVSFLQGPELGELDLTREHDTGRDIAL